MKLSIMKAKAILLSNRLVLQIMAIQVKKI
jgi:hypothetical protein